MKTRLFQVTTPYYCAGFTDRKNGDLWVVDEAAPIIKWIRSQHLSDVAGYFERRKIPMVEAETGLAHAYPLPQKNRDPWLGIRRAMPFQIPPPSGNVRSSEHSHTIVDIPGA